MSRLLNIRIASLIIFGAFSLSLSACELHDSITSLADSIVSEIVNAKAMESVHMDQFIAEGATINSHTVEKGESWEYLASIYGMEVEELQAMNGCDADLYAGQEIQLPEFPQWSRRYENGIVNRNPLFKKASDLMKERKFSKAIKVYNEILKNHTSLTAFYNRGQAYLANDKLSQAAEDFTMVANNDIYGLFSDASALANQASATLEERREARAEMWGNFLGGVVMTGVAVASSYIEMQQAAQIPAKPQGDDIFNSPLLDPKLAIAQVQQQLNQEYHQFILYNKKYDGTDYTFDEWMAIKGEAINQADISTPSNTSNTFDSNHNHSTTSTSSSYQKDCHLCHGTGKCWTCNGEHRYLNPLTGKYVTCPNCKPDGICSACGGSGKKG